MYKVLIGICIALLIGLGISLFFLKREVSKSGALQTSLTTSQQDLKLANKELVKAKMVRDIEDDITLKLNKSDIKLDQEVSEIKLRVLSTAKEVDNGKISPSVASSIYIDSMWEVYCKTGSTDSHCTPSKPPG